jgi:FtsP/CotA-like multicopper oxidase with cupredoxin domain
MKKIISLVCLILVVSLELFSSPLPIPSIIEGKEIDLSIRKGTLQLPFGESDTLGYNGDYLGPTIRVRDGDEVSFLIKNTINEDTTVHWHGLHVPAEFDGGPHQVIRTGETWAPRFKIDQRAATLWYHPHLMGKTAEHVYRGLAGMFIIEDSYSRSLPLPDNYGVNDIPIILQDRDINRKGEFSYRPSMPDIMHGYLGNRMLVNGAYKPELTVDKGTYRFRILNGSNSTIFRVSLNDQSDFTVIASDGGFLPATVKTSQLVIGPGERYEILYDFSSSGANGLSVESWGGKRFDDVLSFVHSSKEGVFYDHPTGFDYEPIVPKRNDQTRSFRMESGMMGRFTINGKAMNMSRVDFQLRKNSQEVWTVTNAGRGMMQLPHTFHVHDVQFSILSINGESPPAIYQGPKDTILLWPGDRYEIAMSFEDYTGIYMYHCHMLEHEDAGMMGQFEIKDD